TLSNCSGCRQEAPPASYRGKVEGTDLIRQNRRPRPRNPFRDARGCANIRQAWCPGREIVVRLSWRSVLRARRFFLSGTGACTTRGVAIIVSVPRAISL